MKEKKKILEIKIMQAKTKSYKCRLYTSNRKLVNLMGGDFMEKQQEVGILSLKEIIHRDNCFCIGC